MATPPPLTPLAAAVLHVAPAPERVLEIECGAGDATLFLAREYPTARVRGVDRSEENVRAATARIGLDPEGRVAFKVGGPRSLPYPDDFFDLVVEVDGRPPGWRDRPGPASRRVPDPRRLRAWQAAPAACSQWLLRRRADPAPGSSRWGPPTPATAASLSAPARRGTRDCRRLGCERMDIEGMPLALLVNPASAGGKTLRLLPRVEQALDARRVDFRVQRTTGLEHGAEQAQLAVEAGEVPVVMSGDGLVGAVGGAMAGSDTPLGILPGGRGNDLARVLGIPSDPEAAVATLFSGQSRRIDVGEANGKRFLGIVSVGFDSECNRLANEVKLIRSNLVYVYSLFRTLAGWKPARFTIRVDDERTRFTGYSVSVANNSTYGGGMRIAPDADLEDGLFDIIAIGEVGKLRYLANLPKVFKGTHLESEDVQVFRAPHVELAPASRSPSTPTAST